MPTPTSLRASDLHRRLEAGEPLQLVDVREDAELELAALTLPVIHLPLSRSAEWLDRLDSLLDREQDLVVLCHAGVRSWQFGSWLMETQGYERVWNLHGGIDAWSVEVDPAVPRY
ncbi:rhodanese-like domain-containing protein [Vulcanococcus limneticus]|uniref:rhodanese-like domain-containing protein n=1 Tax=Vulcanococcus limneticus TaxID=2170428 RepID=UPI00398BE10A